MLVILLKPGESVAVQFPDGEEAKIMVTECRKHGCRIGLEFPDDVRLLRSTLVDRLKAVQAAEPAAAVAE